MGWWWNASSPKGSHQIFLSQSSEKSSTNEPTAHSDFSTAPIPESTKAPLSREEQSNQELIAWLKELQADQADQREATTKDTNIPSSLQNKVENISPDSLYPTEISCRSAFDYAFFCQSFGGQFVNVYRYGEFRSCSNHWQDFWLCMRTRNWEAKDRKKAIQDHYKKKAIKYKQGPSSEDIWSVRTEPAKDAFQGDLEKLEARIAAWKDANPGVKPPIEHHEI